MSIEKEEHLLSHSSGVLCKQTYPIQKMNPVTKTLHTRLREFF